MGLYIPGMEMPKDYAVVVIYKDGTVRRYEDCVETVGGVIGKAIPVPPHGRLIDADKVLNKIVSFLGNHWAAMEIKRAPTIIPAEETDCHGPQDGPRNDRGGEHA